MDKFQNKYRIPSARAKWHDYNGGEYFITICTAGREHYFGEIHDGIMYYNNAGYKMNELIHEIEQHHPYAHIDNWQVMPNHVHLIVEIDENKRKIQDNPVVETGHAPSENVGTDGGTDVETGHAPSENVGTDGGTNGLTDGGTNGLTNVETGHAPSENIGGDGNPVETGHAPSLQSAQQSAQQSTQQPTQSAQQSTQQPTQSAQQSTLPEKMKSISDKKGLLSVAMGNLKSAMTKYCHNSKQEFGWQERFHDHIIRDRDEYFRISEYIKNNPQTWKEDKFYTK